MRPPFQIFLLGCTAGLTLMGCEKHEFEVTKVLHESHGGHHDDNHYEEHEAVKGHDDHAKDDHAKDDHAKDEGKHDDRKVEVGEAGEGRDVGL
jgi:hypothetical protein